MNFTHLLVIIIIIAAIIKSLIFLRKLNMFFEQFCFFEKMPKGKGTFLILG